MSGKEILIDTNIVLYLLKGNDTLEGILQGKQSYVSFMTELELIGFKNMSAQEEEQIASFLNDSLVVSMNNSIKEAYVAIRKKYQLKLADSIIAATAIACNLPLITADKQFGTIKELRLLEFDYVRPS